VAMSSLQRHEAGSADEGTFRSRLRLTYVWLRCRVMRLLVGGVLVVGSAFAVRQFAVTSDGFAAFRPVSASELASRPEAHLYFPGSSVVQVSRRDMRGSLLSADEPAQVATTAATSASKNELIAWYENEMRSRGWVHTCAEVCSPVLHMWVRGKREFFELDFPDPRFSDYVSTNLPTEYVADYELSPIIGISLWWSGPHVRG
jgi:hypothetical protein